MPLVHDEALTSAWLDLWSHVLERLGIPNSWLDEFSRPISELQMDVRSVQENCFHFFLFYLLHLTGAGKLASAPIP